jgi:protein-S-isoprenylcysteine O-methyltransferase Ste14
MQTYAFKLWAVMSAAGFATSFISAKQFIADRTSFASVLTWVGMAIALSGLLGIVYVIILLVPSYDRVRDEFTTSGIYRLVRHPLYLSGIVLNFGVLVAAWSAHGWAGIPLYPLGVIGIVFYCLAARSEDGYNIAKFGERYKRYAERVPGLNFTRGLFQLWIGRTKL